MGLKPLPSPKELRLTPYQRISSAWAIILTKRTRAAHRRAATVPGNFGS
jgi:hypothetical protein